MTLDRTILFFSPHNNQITNPTERFSSLLFWGKTLGGHSPAILLLATRGFPEKFFIWNRLCF